MGGVGGHYVIQPDVQTKYDLKNDCPGYHSRHCPFQSKLMRALYAYPEYLDQTISHIEQGVVDFKSVEIDILEPLGMDDWKGIIAAIEFILQYRKTPKDDVVMLANAIHKGDAIVFSPEEITEALKQAIESEDDLSDVIKQKHSDEILRGTFSLLLKELAR